MRASGDEEILNCPRGTPSCTPDLSLNTATVLDYSSAQRDIHIGPHHFCGSQSTSRDEKVTGGWMT